MNLCVNTNIYGPYTAIFYKQNNIILSCSSHLVVTNLRYFFSCYDSKELVQFINKKSKMMKMLSWESFN